MWQASVIEQDVWPFVYLRWNLSVVDTIGAQLAVLYREVSLIQRQICTQVYVVGTADAVLIWEVSFIERFHSTSSSVWTLRSLWMWTAHKLTVGKVTRKIFLCFTELREKLTLKLDLFWKLRTDDPSTVWIGLVSHADQMTRKHFALLWLCRTTYICQSYSYQYTVSCVATSKVQLPVHCQLCSHIKGTSSHQCTTVSYVYSHIWNISSLTTLTFTHLSATVCFGLTCHTHAPQRYSW